MATETQVYEVLVEEGKAQAVHDTIKTALEGAKESGAIISASYTRKLVKRGSV